ncbi:hypothetical protein ACJKIH_17060 [Brucella pseudogrignonensis]|uniref:hypothetical protein n=1 Tax=Brucella pseudogrignonensis TaxID=419475 RepID=UPI0038B4DC5C
MISVKNSINEFEIEKLFAELQNGGESVLQLPNHVAADTVGIEAALSQLAITWGRKFGRNARLKLHADRASDNATKNFANTSYGLTALNFAGKIESRAKEPQKISKSEAMIHALSALKAMDDGDYTALKEAGNKKNLLPFLCIDNSSSFSALRSFYAPDRETVKSLEEFHDFLRETVNFVRLRDLWEPSNEFLKNAASMLFEAFSNTHDHARSNLDNAFYPESVRGVIIARRVKSRNELLSDAGWSEPLKGYYGDFELNNSELANIALLEISIFDSGPGMAQTWLKKQAKIRLGLVEDNVTLDDEIIAFNNCLRKGFSRRRHVSRGFGLFRIMQSIRMEKGFIKFRSGRLSLFASFKDISADDDSHFELFDLRTGGKPELHAFAEGTRMTIVLPLNLKS